MDKLYNISEVADKLNLSPKTLRRWEESNKFTPSRTLGNQRRYSISDLQVLDAIKHNVINSQSELLTIEQAAALFGVTPTTITRWENEGKIHPFITSAHTFYPRPRLVAKLEELKHDAAEKSREEREAIKIKSQRTTPTYTKPSSPQPPTPQPSKTPQPKTSQTKSLESSGPKDVSQLGIVINIVVTITLILGYHLFINNSSTPISPSTTTPRTQPTELTTNTQTTENKWDPILDKVLSPLGTISTPNINLTPGTAPSGQPGSLYFDSGTQSLRVYTNTWIDIARPPEYYQPHNTSLLSGIETIAKGQSSTKVDNSLITPETPITVTFLTDYSPGKKYWLDVNPGSFTLHTDFPVGTASQFSYLILAEEATQSATTTF